MAFNQMKILSAQSDFSLGELTHELATQVDLKFMEEEVHPMCI